MTASHTSDVQTRSGGLGILSLDRRVAVVTGGSSGIGRATAFALAGAGATVAVGYHSGADRAEAVVASLPGEGHLAVQISVDDTGTLEAAADHVHRELGRCDVLVNSGGWTRKIAHSQLDDVTDELFDDMMRVNVRGPFAVIRTFASLLQASDDAVVVNVSSLSGTSASGSNIAYCASKAALDNLTKSLARVMGPQVRVIGVAPAAVDTDFVAGRGRDAVVAQAAGTPLQIVVHPDDVATSILGAVTHLRIATGTTLQIDGGKHL